jgi:hypothetical protein
MGAWYDEIPHDDILKWMLDQKLWFVASAPLSGKGHVNLSPRGGYDSVRLHVRMHMPGPGTVALFALTGRTPINIVGKNACWFPDMTGSGAYIGVQRISARKQQPDQNATN